MATEVVRWCDVCMTSDERVPGAAHALQLDGRSGTLDLCPQHSKALLAPLLELLAPTPRLASPTQGRRLEPGDSTCLVCLQSLRTERVGAHVKKAHSLTLGDVYGLTCPLCDLELGSSSGLSLHAGRTHGVDGGIPGLWLEVERAGDPRGLVAARRAALGVA